MTSPLRPGDPGVASGVQAALTRTRRPGPLDLAWHWRWEIGSTAITAGLATFIVISSGAVELIMAAGAGLAVIGTVCYPPARKAALARARCVITAHRLRKGCASSWVQTRGGQLPWVMSCNPAEYGERARLWLRAGLSAGDLIAVREALAAACWAADVRVIRDARHAHLVTVEVIRHLSPQRDLAPPRPSWPASHQEDGDPADPGDTYLPAR